MNKLRVEKKSSYVIEVNDAGETIEFNIEDPTLALRAEKARQDVMKIADKCKLELSVINKQKDSKTKGSILSKKQREQMECYNKMYQDMRKAMDAFLGQGACQKIFGETNYLTMYDELFEALRPHFEKMGLNAESLKDSIVRKYQQVEDATIE